jgi:hypothetical protein
MLSGPPKDSKEGEPPDLAGHRTTPIFQKINNWSEEKSSPTSLRELRDFEEQLQAYSD